MVYIVKGQEIVTQQRQQQNSKDKKARRNNNKDVVTSEEERVSFTQEVQSVWFTGVCKNWKNTFGFVKGERVCMITPRPWAAHELCCIISNQNLTSSVYLCVCVCLSSFISCL
jgi:hypothetical protein